MTTFIDAYILADALYRAGYQARQKEQDYDPRGCMEWQAVVDAILHEAAPAAPVQTQIPAEIQGMADCMGMVRQELIEAGVIDASVAPMFIANAVIAKLQNAAAPVQTDETEISTRLRQRATAAKRKQKKEQL